MLTILKNNGHPDPSSKTTNGLLFFGMPPSSAELEGRLRNGGHSVDFLGGHMGWRDLEIVSAKNPDLSFTPFTILREPNERMLSFWAFLSDLKQTNMSLPRRLEQMLPNTMYRQLAPFGSNLSDTSTTLKAIKDLLSQRFSVVGLTERFDETLLLLQEQGILTNIAYSNHKVLADKRLSFKDLSAEHQELLTNHNSLDLELYQWVVEQFEQRIQRGGASFQTQLAELRQQQLQQQESTGNCEDDAPEFGSWRCDQEKRRNALAENDKRRDARPGELKALEIIKRSLRPRYW